MKRFIILLITVTIFFSVTGVYADSGMIRVLTLEEAKQMALENSIKYQLQDSYISDALDNYYDVQDANDKMNLIPSSGMMNYFNRTITPEVSIESAANSVKLSRFEKNDIKRASDYNVEMAFINIKKAQMELETKKNEASIKLIEHKDAKLEFDLGLLRENELKEYRNAYNDAAADQQVAFTDLKSQYQTLNRYLGRAIDDYNIEIAYDLFKPEISSINLEEIRAANLKNNVTYYTLQQNAALAKRKYDLTKERYEHFEKLGVQNKRQDMLDTYSDAERDYINARQSFEDATKELDISLNSMYNSLKTTADAADRLERDISIFKDELNLLKKSYENGFVSKNDYIKQQTALKTMQNSLNSLLADLNKQYISMMLYIG